MPVNAKYKAIYEFGEFYHVFNRTSAKQLMFNELSNYYFFLEKFQHYLGNYVDVVAKCLIPNHFHFLIRVRMAADMPPLPFDNDIHTILTRQFKNFFICYSMSIKKMFNLSGNVFAQKYKHIRLYTDRDVKRIVLYIHRNPLHHACGNWKTYRWSSYNDILFSNKTNKISAFTLSLFGGREGYIKAHEELFGQGSEP